MLPRERFCLGLGLVLLTLAAAAPAAAEQLTVDYTFGRPTVAPVWIGDQNYDRVTLPGASRAGNVGQPVLPARGAAILLPYNTQLAGVEITAGEKVLVGSGYRIEPVGMPVPLSAGPDAARPPVPDAAIYGSDNPFPATRFEQIGVQGFRGFQILILKLQPLEYIPTTGELYYFPHLTVAVDLAAVDTPPASYRGFADDIQQARSRVDNPAVADTYPAAERGPRSYSLLIIATPEMAAAFEPLKTYHNSHSLPTEIHTTAEIGSTNPDNIRTYIYNQYLSAGIEYVLIGADDSLIPAKDLYVDGTPNMPGDLYFSCLEGTWNYDGDGNWGEPNDGPGGGPLDLIADVYVGRAAADNATEATRFVNKTIWYLSGLHQHPWNVLLVGEYLGFGGESEYATNAMNELIDGCNGDGYTTVGFPSDLFNIDTLYDAPGYDWPASELVNHINAGLHIVNHLGHGNVDYAMKLYNPDVMNLANSDLCFFYSQTCLAGHFDDAECWAETADIKTDHAAFGVVMNAREGYGAFDSTDGPSQRYNREFWDAVFNPDESKREMGRANSDSKEDNLWRINEEIMRWCYYEINLFGDPSVALPGSCSDAGTVELDSPKYACTDTGTIKVLDCGLNVNPGGVDTATVTVTSTSDPVGETATLIETAPNSAYFQGTFAVSTTESPGVVLVAPGDTITVTYIDADNGSGQQVTVTATALVDCTPPTISNVHMADIQPRSATVAFTSNEVARGTVHYGLSCDSLIWTALGGYALAPTVDLSGLNDNTTYYYKVDATDEAGNTTSDPTCRSFTTPEIPDYFTEVFTGNNDLDNLSLSFTPNGSNDSYFPCVEQITQLPTDPTGGTTLSLSDDSYALVNIGSGATVLLYGASYNHFYVGSNGYITFNSGDTNYTASPEAHFNQPRVTGLMDDLNPATGGSVSWKQLADRVVVTWLNVPEYGTSNQNTFQFELYFNGQIKLNFLNLDCNHGMAGLSAGGGVPADFFMSDLSALGPCQTFPPTAHDGTASTNESTPVNITLSATDEGMPNPPGALSYTVMSLPAHGSLADPGAGAIASVPYTLVGYGKVVQYTPVMHYVGSDSFQFKASDGGTPPDGGDSNTATITIDVIGVPELIYSFALDSNPGWTTTGAWAFGHPTGGGSHLKDPSNGHTGTNVYGYNLSGDYTNNLTPKYLTATALNCTNVTGVELRFWRWLGVEASDHAGIEISTDGTTWAPVWSNNTAISEAAWSHQVYSLPAADHRATVYLRWVLGPTDVSVTYPGWNIDDIEIWALVPAPATVGDLNCDGTIGFGDINPFVLALTNPAGYATAYPNCNIMNGDINADGTVGFGDINPFVALLTGK
jgi:hypothetical protein